VARLRACSTGHKPIMLRINFDIGHGSAPGRFDRLKDIALIYAFAIAAVEKTLPGM
jgi:oligopeptidase B